MQQRYASGERAHSRALWPLVVLLLPVLSHSQSAPTQGALQVHATITSGCRVVGSERLTDGIDFGTLDFGTVPSLFNTTLAAQAQSSLGVVELTCSGVTSAQVAISTGAQPNGQQRQLASGANRVPYQLYADAGFATAFVGATPVAVSISPSGAAATVALPIHGRIQATPGGYAAGQYSDQVQITISW